MSEYWKSTPKYWCKHCKTFVRDTKLEKQNHEATPKHQGNLKRFLRDLHRGNERDEREKQRAKDEVARLNGTNVGSSTSSFDQKLSKPLASMSKQEATLAERKKQMARLAEMGVAIPEEFRREMAMVGDWQTLSQRVIDEETGGMKKEEPDEDTKSMGLNVGVRKRKHEGEEEDNGGVTMVKRGWGSTTRTYPGISGDVDDLDALLNSTTSIQPRYPPIKAEAEEQRAEFKPCKTTHGMDASPVTLTDNPIVKTEDLLGNLNQVPMRTQNPDRPSSISVEEKEDIGIVFKKRKPKPVRQK